MKTITNEVEYYQACSEAVFLAKAILSGNCDFLSSVNRLSALPVGLRIHENDTDFLIFTAICSETDHLPLEKARPYYSANLIEQHERELEEIKARYKNDVEKSCTAIIERFSKTI